MNVEERVRSALASDAARTPRGEPIGAGVTMRKGRRRRTTRRVGVATAVAVAFVGVVFFAVPGDQPPATETPAATQPAPTVVEDVEPEPSPSTTLRAEAVEPSAPITGMTWQQITPDGINPTTSGMGALVSGGDRFLYVESSGQVVSTSFDGINWTRQLVQGSFDRLTTFLGWQDTIVGFGCGGASSSGGGLITPVAGCVSVIHSDGTVARQSFDGDINGAGIGPSGMVVIITNHYDEDGLQYAAEDELAWNLTGRDINELEAFELSDGVLHVEYADQVADYVLSDHGYSDIQSQVASGWFSQHGEQWIPIPDFPAGDGWDLVGTEDGFVATSDSGVWHSSNGMDWRELGQSAGDGSTLSRWSDGAIVVGTESVWYVSGLGIVETPLTTTGLEPFISTSDNVGLVVIDIEGETMDLNQIRYSPNGQAWTNTNVPPEMRDLDLTWSAWHYPVEAVATDTNVMLLLNVAIGGGDSSRLVWFLGTPITD